MNSFERKESISSVSQSYSGAYWPQVSTSFELDQAQHVHITTTK